MARKRAKIHLTLPLALLSGWGISLAAIVNFVVIGYVIYADGDNSFGLESGDVVTVVGSYDDSALVDGTGTVLFGAGSGNTFKVVAGDKTYTQSSDADYQTGGYPAVAVGGGSVQGVEFYAPTNDWEYFQSSGPFFNGDDGNFGTVSGVWGTGAVFNGVLPGGLNISPAGAAAYSVPIEVPLGIGGLQPQLSLEYSSQTGNGLLGIGWSLSGLSAITRCPATLAQDNSLEPVDFNSNDRLCLDGQRLISVTNTGCAGGAEYRTEVDSFARICAYGVQGSGPAWLKIWTKAGQVMEYGVTADARIEANTNGAYRSDVMVWALNKVSDTLGNYLTVTYQEDNPNGEYYPLRIDYTGNASQGMVPYHSVRFSYEQRPDQLSGWVGGSVARSRVRMTNAKAYAGTEVVRDYRLAYEMSSMTARSRLASLTSCAGAGYSAKCQPSTALTWSYGTSAFDPAVNSGRSNAGSYYAQAMDVNGDGKTDLAYCVSATSAWQILISNGNGFDAPTNTGVLCTKYQYAVQIDSNSDGRMDLLVPYANSRWYILRSTGAGFSLVATGVPDSGWDTRPVAMDVDGDGQQDLVLSYGSQWVIRINNGSGFNAPIVTGINSVNWQYRLELDYNADGMMDLLVPYANNRWYVLRSTGSGFQLTDTGVPSTGYDGKPQVLDVNGDGLQDLVTSHSDRRWIFINRGGSFSPAIDAGVSSIGADGSHYRLDFDGDGKDDIFVAYGVAGACAPGYACTGDMLPRWSVLRSIGYGFELINIASAVTADQRPGDFDGDGFVDLATAHNDTWHVLRHAPGIPDQLSGIADGAGGAINIVYKPLTDASVYSKGTSSAYPQQSIQAPLYVVSQTSTANGVGGTNVRRYNYADARVNLRGRGFLGFQTVTSVDEESQIRTLTTYHQSFPYIGRVISEDTRRVNASAPLKALSNSWNDVPPYTGVYQPRITDSSEHTYELDGSHVSTVSTSYSLYDAFGNAQRIDVHSTGGALGGYNYKSTVNVYTNDVAQWHLGRLTRSTATSTTSTGTDTRTSTFEYDVSTGQLTAEIIEPDDPQLLLRTEYGYDAYGNKASMTVRDSGSNSHPVVAAVSTTHYDYGGLVGYGTYTITSTNAKGHTETQVVDARYGKPLSLVGPNGFTTQWQYDGFGRQTQETRADGTWTRTVYSRAPCATNALYKVTTQTSGSMPLGVCFDRFDRELRRETVVLNGNLAFQDTQYDSLGRTARVSRPYMANTAPRWTDYQYDAIGRVRKETSPDGGIVETTYNGLSTSVRRYDVNATYDQTVTRITDVAGNLTQAIDEGYQSTYYQYDPFGNLTQVTDPANNATVMSYDRRGRKLAMTEPNMGAWEYGYDALGQLRWQKNGKNQTTTMDYDVLGRVIRRVQPEGTSTWTYDTRARGIGKLSQVNGPNGYIERHYYDALSRPQRVEQVVDGGLLKTITAYDTFSRVVRTTYPSGFVLRYQYNAQGHLYRLVNNANTAERYWTAQAVDAEGHVTQELLGNGLSTVRTFDPASGRLTYLGTYGNTTNVQMLNYQYDALGNLRGREDVVQGLSETFQYDAFNRLTQATIAGVGTKNWSYDGLGNITSKDGHSDYAYANGRPHAVSYARGSTHTYDANGNLQMSYGAQSRYITWNSANLPTWIWANNQAVDFSYNPDGARYKQVATVNGVTRTTLYAGSHHEQVTANGVTTHKDYISAGGRTVAIRETVNGAAAVKYLHQDHLGSTDVITAANGQVLERQSFDAFGSRRVATSWHDPVAALTSVFSTRGYTGHEQLDGVGLIHMNGRVYDPELGRFLSADPVVQYPAGAQGLNRYSYTDNNPLSRVDPSGYGWFSKAWKSVKNAVKKVFSNPVVQAVITIAAAVVCGPGCAALASATFTKINGGSWADALKAGATTWGVAWASYGIGEAFGYSAKFLSGSHIGKTLAHGTVGGAASTAMGGKFKSGFMAGGFTAFAAPGIGTMRLNDVGKVMAAAVVGGTASELGGGKFANGAKTSAFAYLFSSAGTSPAQGGSSGLGRAALDVVGKIWALPNTVIGLAYGGAGHVLGWMMGTNPSISFANNAIQFENNPLMASAMTFGNVIVYGTDPVYFQPGSQRGQYTLGYEEMQHTYQAQVLGPLYFPGHIVSGAAGLLMDRDWHGSSAFLEVGPHSRNPRPWP